MDLEGLLSEPRGYEGLKRKKSIGRWSRPFLGAPPAGPGDDAGAVVLGDGFLLLSGEGIWPALLEDLRKAGVCWAQIGEVTEGSKIAVEWEGETGLFLDWRRSPVTGLFKSQC